MNVPLYSAVRASYASASAHHQRFGWASSEVVSSGDARGEWRPTYAFEPSHERTEGTSELIKDSSRERPITIALIDDNRLLREGLAAMIRLEAEFSVLHTSSNADDALRVSRASAPDVVLLDFGQADHDSLAVAAAIRRELPTSRVIVIGLVAVQQDVADFVRAGASGFVMKDASFDELLNTIRLVANGGRVLPPALTTSLFTQILLNAPARDKAQAPETIRLTARETDVINALADGLSNKEIAGRLHIAVHTVKSHVRNVLGKLSLRSRLEVVAYVHSSAADRPSKN